MSALAMSQCRVSEIQCQTLLVKSELADYTINCYRGCEHGCLYCYAKFVSRFSHAREEWGTFVDVRVNAVAILVKEVRKRKQGRVFVSSVCDGWQPLEGKYQLTRHCLEILLHHDFPITVLTKSQLVLRDLDLLSSKQGVELGVTVTTPDEKLRCLVEPRSSSFSDRLLVLEEAKRRHITTYAFLGPLLPFLSDTVENLSFLLRVLREIRVDYFYLDCLNPGAGVWTSLSRMLLEHFPLLVPQYRTIIYNPEIRDAYRQSLRKRATQVARELSLQDHIRFCF